MRVISLMTLLEFGGSDSLAGSNRNVTVVPGGPRIIIATSLKDFCIAGMPSTSNSTSPACITPLSAAEEFRVNPATRKHPVETSLNHDTPIPAAEL